mgnify:CR=1 FL=1
MSKILLNTKDNLKKIIEQAINNAVKDNKLPKVDSIKFNIEIPADNKNGDFSSNVAMVNAKNFKMSPISIAKIICEYLNLDKTLFDKFEVAGPGFINFFFSKDFYSSIIDDILKLKENYGKSDFGQNKKVMVEFVSANPTGPMHMGNARGGALGDCLASVLDAAGYDVKREFYINDAGNQIEKFGISLEVRYLQILEGEDAHPLPEDSYHGEDIKDLANEFIKINGDSYLNVDPTIRQKALIDFALPKNINKMKTDLEKYRIEFDRWFHEIDLHNNGEIDETIEVLKNNDMTYEKDGALWYKATKMGSEKDEVLIRKNGNPTYFTADIAYHRNKFLKRGFDTCIDIWGADHHGHVARMKGAMDAIGLDGNKLDVILMQLVKLVKDGQIVRMSKRTGKAIQLADLLDEVSVDAARFIFNMREANSQMDFDLDLAVKEDAQNPVYYVQYAHARICSILKALEKENIYPKNCSKNELYLLTADEEKELIRHLSIYTNEIIESAKTYDPARITRYVITLATLFHKFYNACRVHCDNESLMYARLNLCICVKIVINNILSMFKISVPESM